MLKMDENLYYFSMQSKIPDFITEKYGNFYSKFAEIPGRS
jgi:hypothetical protein